MTPSECEQKRMDWMSYDVGGGHYGTGDYRAWVEKLKKEYADGGCGKDTLMEKCLYRKELMTTLTNNITALTQQGDFVMMGLAKKQFDDVLKDFNASGCQKKVEESKAPMLKDAVSKFTNLDQSRIDANSIYERNKKIFFGASFLLLGFLVILINKSDK